LRRDKAVLAGGDGAGPCGPFGDEHDLRPFGEDGARQRLNLARAHQPVQVFI
jgi:hypothetical protein